MLFLFALPTTLTLLYAFLEYKGYLDLWFGRQSALDGLKRLKCVTGYPNGWIYDDEQDNHIFNNLFNRINRKTEAGSIRQLSRDGIFPSCIVIGGSPIAILGVPDDWQQAWKFGYLPEHSVMFLYGLKRHGDSSGKALRACSLSQIETWLAEEKDSRKYWVGAVLISIFTFLLIPLRVNISIF